MNKPPPASSFLETATHSNASASQDASLRELEQILFLATTGTGTTRGNIKGIDGDQLPILASLGESGDASELENALSRHTLDRQQLATYSDLGTEPAWKTAFTTPQSQLPRRYAALPLTDAEEQPIGLIEVFGDQPGEFSAEQRQALLALASVTAALLQTNRLKATLERTKSELRHSREAYDKSEAFYHSLVESLPQNILRKDLEGTFTFANQNFCQALGKPLEAIIGKTDFDFFPADLAEKYQRDDRQVSETGQRFETTEKHQTATMEDAYVHVVKTPIYDRDGQIVGIQGIFWDVTEQRKTEKDLAFERDLLRSLLDSIPDHVYFKDQSSRFIICSKELTDRLGLASPEDAIGKTDFDFFSQKHAQPAFEDEQQIIATGNPVIGKVEREILKDGKENWILTSKMPFRSASGAIIGTFGVSKDVTSLIETRQELEKAQKKYQDIFEKAVEGIFQTTPDGTYLEANPALARIYGYHSASELLREITDIGKQLYVDQKRRIEFQRTMEAQGEVHDFESEIYRQDGSKIWIAETARVVKDETNQVKYYEGIVEDISERKRAEAAMQLARDAALESTRLKSIFLANMSHEIRTPMNGIIGMAGLLRRTDLAPEQEHFANTIEQSGLTLLRLINDILDFSKMESGKMKLEKAEFDPSKVMESVVELLAENAYRKGIELILRVDPKIPPSVIGDATRLRQVLNNLVGNAIKFTPEGQVEVILQPARTQGQKCRLSIEVIDSGIGIDREAKRHIFKAFTQADESTTRRFGGTGLGLAISRQLIELMGGRLQVESEKGKGSRFWFTLPFERCQAERPKQTLNPHLRGARVLVVAANRAICSYVQHSLASNGIQTVIANSISRARQILNKDTSGQFDYVIVDWNVSGNRGLKLCSTVSDMPQGDQIKKILLVPVGKKIPSRRLVDCDISCVVTKPIRPGQILNSLERAYEGEKAGGQVAPGPLSVETPEATPSTGITVLVVEDNPVNQSVALHVLKELGYDGVAADNGLEAIALLNQRSFPIIFMDCQMPELDGYETTRQIREMEARDTFSDRKPVRIIAMTANAMEGDRQRCLDAGMDDYISKPVMLPAVEAALKNASPTGATPSAPAPQPNGTEPSSADAVPRLDAEVLKNFQKADRNDSYDPLEDLAALFTEEVSRQLQAMKSALETKQGGELHRLAHTFKGSANNLGARRLAHHCLELESAGEDFSDSDGNAFANILSAIETEADQTLSELATLVESRRPAP